MNVIERAQHYYIKYIKKWMFCPVCNAKMHISKDGKMWKCRNCKYSLTDKEFKEDFVFWFCDECNSYLNIQEDFDRHSDAWICKKCGHKNGLTKEELI